MVGFLFLRSFENYPLNRQEMMLLCNGIFITFYTFGSIFRICARSWHACLHITSSFLKKMYLKKITIIDVFNTAGRKKSKQRKKPKVGRTMALKTPHKRKIWIMKAVIFCSLFFELLFWWIVEWENLFSNDQNFWQSAERRKAAQTKMPPIGVYLYSLIPAEKNADFDCSMGNW